MLQFLHTISSQRKAHTFILCIVALSILLLAASRDLQAGVVTGEGIPRVVDGPQGEVVVTSVANPDQNVVQPDNPEYSSTIPSSGNTPKAATPEPEENVNSIEYHDTALNPEDTEPQQTGNDNTKLIMIGVAILVVGLLLVLFFNKRKQ